MAMKQMLATWNGMGGTGSIQVPDRLKVTCRECGKEIGKDCALEVTRTAEDALVLTTNCSCGSVGGPAKVEFA